VFGLLAVSAGAAPPPYDPQTLLQRAAAAYDENRRRSYNFVWREEILTRDYSHQGTLAAETTETFEVAFVEGETYHRHISRNGQALPPDLAAEEERRFREVAEWRRRTPYEERRRRHFEAEGRRLTLDLRLVADYHDARYVGEEVVRDRPAWILETRPRRGIPKPKSRRQWTFVLSSHLAIDQQTLLPIHMVYTQLKDFDGIEKDRRTEVVLAPVDGVWLVYRIVSVGPILGRKRETIQDYSQYRRFTADTIIRFEEREP
jgi:hypothetical protein